MAQLDTIILEVLTPDSESNLAFEEYEFMLIWQSRKGVQLSWLFTDWINFNNTQTTPINVTDPDEINSIISNEERIIRLTAEDLTRDQREGFEDLLSSKKISRLFRTNSALFEQGGTEKYANRGGSIENTQSKQRFNFTINIQRFSRALPN